MTLIFLEKTNMKAAIYRGPKQIEFVSDMQKPTARAGEILIRVRAVGICGTDLHFYNEGVGIKPGAILGHEFSGVVEELGEGVTGWRIGQQVVAEHVISCGVCAYCRSGAPNLCIKSSVIGIDQPGALAEYLAVPADLVYAVPEFMDFAAAALIEPLSIAVYVVRNYPSLLDKWALVLGQGPIGLLVSRVARLAGAKVVGVDMMQERLDFARNGGFVDYVINSQAPTDVAAEFRKLSSGIESDVTFEAVGRQETVDIAIDVTKKRGTIFLIGLFRGPEKIHIDNIVKRELRVDGSYTCAFSFPTAINLAASGRVDLASLITHRYSIERVADAFADAASYKRHPIKTVITID